MKNNLKGSIILLITAIIWGTAFVAQSSAAEHVGAFTFNCARSFVGGLVLIPIILAFRLFGRKSGESSEEKAPLRLTVIGGICCGTALAVASAFQQFGIAQTTTGKAGFITSLYIIIVPLLELFRGRKPSRIIVLCLAIAVVGFYLLSIHGSFSISMGDLLVLICAVCFAGHIITIDYFNSKNCDGMLMSCIQFFTAGVLSGIMMFVFEQPQLSDLWMARFDVLYAGVMSSGVAYTLQIIGQRYTKPTLATLLMSLEAVFAAISGWILLGQGLSPVELCGCALVFAAVILAQIPLPQKKLRERV